jgi:hypothetical protein
LNVLEEKGFGSVGLAKIVPPREWFADGWNSSDHYRAELSTITIQSPISQVRWC